MKIEAGKYYRLRDGHKFRCYATNGCGTHPVHGATDMRDGSWCMTLLTLDGRYNFNGGECGLDIVAEWRDEPKVDPEIWKGLAAFGFYYVASDSNGHCGAFAQKPEYRPTLGQWVAGASALRLSPAVYLEPCEPENSLAVSPLLPK